jgi:hypothetical protein
MEIMVGIASLVVAVGVPVGLFIMSGFRGDISGIRGDLNRVHTRIDLHITDHSIHSQ